MISLCLALFLYGVKYVNLYLHSMKWENTFKRITWFSFRKITCANARESSSCWLCTFQVLGVAFVGEYAEREHIPFLQCSTLDMAENKWQPQLNKPSTTFFSLSQRVLSESELVIMRVRFEVRLGKNVLWPLIKVKEILACWEQNVSLQDRNHMPGVGAKPMDAGSFFVDGLIDCTHKP